jgi:hypothetical protein
MGHLTRDFFLKLLSCHFCGALSDERSGLSCVFYITYINSVCTSQEAQDISLLQPGTLTTRLQRQSTFFYITYINSVRTSQETRYISFLQPGTLTTRPQRHEHRRNRNGTWCIVNLFSSDTYGILVPIVQTETMKSKIVFQLGGSGECNFQPPTVPERLHVAYKECVHFPNLVLPIKIPGL